MGMPSDIIETDEQHLLSCGGQHKESSLGGVFITDFEMHTPNASRCHDDGRPTKVKFKSLNFVKINVAHSRTSDGSNDMAQK